ncbi:ABC transporter ATP-binding protein [Anaerosphaera multitolerans]|uniref:ABC transporter ATP-binding protein n=1 Tax=Anaerosphaera multitolerans TaxID=2487351 RepID=A0A437S8P6_9FIRM|nr:ABC transporter ATP-binding protein [Anaerosphaera multitolerans]RVU55463.1 ABC transporter ATP-binding protein [Anaerosphaera multitolerans]
MRILEGKNLVRHYNTGVLVKALDDVSISVDRGEFVAVVGTSGSGKTTLLQLLGGLDRPTSGKVYIEGKDIFALKDDELSIFRRRHIGFIFQSYNLIPVLNVRQNIVFPLALDGNDIDEDFFKDIVNTLGIEDKLASMPNELSGGQQQRVAIARAIVTKPAIILADEPTGNLDSRTTMDVMGLIKASSKKYNQTVVLITHNESIAQMADRIIRIEDGKIFGGELYD